VSVCLIKRDSVQSIRDPLLSVEEEEEAKSSSRYLPQHADWKVVCFQRNVVAVNPQQTQQMCYSSIQDKRPNI